MSPRTAARVHAESLLRVPLVERVIRHGQIRLAPRAVDRRWVYAGHVQRSVVGFNPFDGRVFYGGESRLASWLDAPHRSARAHNEADWLVKELWMLVHDFLHGWAYGLIRALAPKLDLGRARITERNFEDLVFAHVLTEAVATVGFDYWCLATLELGEVCPIGSMVTNFTAPYREKYLGEYRRARPDLVVQDVAFFGELARFYLSGMMFGFDDRDLRRSPMLKAWIGKELSYGGLQRRYIRQWLRYLAGLPVLPVDDGPIAHDARWQRALIEEVGCALWTFVKTGTETELRILDPEEAWRLPKGRALDPRFVNLGTSTAGELEALLERDLASDQVDCIIDQHLSGFDYGAFDRDKLVGLPTLRKQRDLRGLVALTKRETRVQARRAEPRTMLMLA
jgi:hypothetical protein